MLFVCFIQWLFNVKYDQSPWSPEQKSKLPFYGKMVSCTVKTLSTQVIYLVNHRFLQPPGYLHNLDRDFYGSLAWTWVPKFCLICTLVSYVFFWIHPHCDGDTYTNAQINRCCLQNSVVTIFPKYKLVIVLVLYELLSDFQILSWLPEFANKSILASENIVNCLLLSTDFNSKFFSVPFKSQLLWAKISPPSSQASVQKGQTLYVYSHCRNPNL